MKKIKKPENYFQSRSHSTSPLQLQQLQKQIFQDQFFQTQWSAIKILESETRAQILLLLSIKDYLCVGDIADTLRLDISAISHQLRLLKAENLVTNRKKGRVVFYILEKELPSLIRSFLNEANKKQS